jgi:predicted glycosyltransferase
MRFLLYNSSARGLGHLSRAMKISTILVSTHKDANAMVVVGNAFRLKERIADRVDFIKLPDVMRGTDGSYHAKSGEIGVIFRLRESLLAGIVQNYDPDIFFVDTYPRGVNGELISALKWLKANTQSRIVLLLRDILDSPETVTHRWRQYDIYRLIDEIYDFIVVFGEKSVLDVVAEYEMASVEERVHYVGYLEPNSHYSGKTSEHESESDKHILVTVGGGSDGNAIIKTVVGLLRGDDQPRHKFKIVVGPESKLSAEDPIFKGLAGDDNVEVVSYVDDLDNWMRNCELVICMGGYNTLSEVLYYKKKAIVIPREMPTHEQEIRAKLMQACFGDMWTISRQALSKATLGRAIDLALSSPPSRKPFKATGEDKFLRFVNGITYDK